MDSGKAYVWRIDLGRTERFWSGWFQGLSATYLSIPVPKMLLLAGLDRLDRELTVGQMQGKIPRRAQRKKIFAKPSLYDLTVSCRSSERPMLLFRPSIVRRSLYLDLVDPNDKNL